MNKYTYKLRNLPHLLRGYSRIAQGALCRLFFVDGGMEGNAAFRGQLSAVLHHDGKDIDLGVISVGVVTTAFVNFLVDQLQAESALIGDFKFHDSGTGTTAEAVGDTALVTKVETGRATGTQEEGASANIYKSVATITYTATRAITEHGLFNASTAGTLLDRSVFAAVNVVNTDSITFTYQLTCSAGG